jgi:hypothetical protein
VEEGVEQRRSSRSQTHQDHQQQKGDDFDESSAG